jgi:hypothetical protein
VNKHKSTNVKNKNRGTRNRKIRKLLTPETNKPRPPETADEKNQCIISQQICPFHTLKHEVSVLKKLPLAT